METTQPASRYWQHALRCLKLPLLQAGAAQLPQPLLTGQVLQPVQPVGPTLNWPQFISVLLALGSQN